MIKKYKQFNESIKSLLKGPTKEEVWGSFGFRKTFDTPEEFLTELFSDLETTTDGEFINYNKKNKLIFEIEKNTFFSTNGEYYALRLNHRYWDILTNIFYLGYKDKLTVIKKVVKQIFNIEPKNIESIYVP